MLEGLTDRQSQLIVSLREKLSLPLPGWTAQKALSPILHQVHPATPPDATEAGVMLLLRPSTVSDDFQVIYMMRGSKYGADKHKGQISFPGGKREVFDTDLLDCALRETEEELGIDRSAIVVLGPLSDFYVFVSGFIVSPFVGLIPADTIFHPDVDEVEYLIETDLTHLQDPTSLKYRNHHFGKKVIKNSPYFDLGNGDMLWGATSMMTNEFLSILRT